jgi:phosphoribosylglycinamide formyltransferase-1
MKKLDIAVLISGRGSNMQALVEACARPDFPARVVCVISNRPDAGGLQFAENANIPTKVINHKDFPSREAFDAALDAALRDSRADLVCLAGFMRILDPAFVNGWQDKLINIHPSLLPAFKGLHIHERAIAAGVRFTGCTVHFVRPEMDDGPIILQAAVPVHEDDTPDTLGARVLQMEHIVYPEAVRLIALGRVSIENERVKISRGVYLADGVVNPIPYK